MLSDRPRVRRAAVLLVTLAAAAIVAFVVLRASAPRLTYFPGPAPPPVAEVLPGGDDVALTTADGLELRAWWLEGGPTAVLVLPGNAGNRAARAPLAAALHELGLSVLLVDYRGYGGNPGSPSQSGLLADARAAADWLASRSDVGHVVHLGESLGGAVVLGLARERSPDAVVLRSPFTSLTDVARSHFGPVPRWLLRDRYPAESWVADLDAPLLVVTGSGDDVVPPTLSRRLYAAAPDPKELVTVPGAGHNDRSLLDGEVFIGAVQDFLDDHGLVEAGRVDEG